MQATGTLRSTGASRGVWLWVVVLIAGMLLAGAGGYLAHGTSTSGVAQPSAAPSGNEPQPVDGLQP